MAFGGFTHGAVDREACERFRLYPAAVMTAIPWMPVSAQDVKVSFANEPAFDRSNPVEIDWLSINKEFSA